MIRLLGALVLVSTLAYPLPVKAADFQATIVGGQEAVRGEFPFIVSLQSASGSHFCGGSLIRKNWVLTAHHCIQFGAPGSILIGLHDRRNTAGSETFRPLQVISHPKVNMSKMSYDFALIKLDGESRFEPVELNREEIRSAVDFVTAGWGGMREGGGLAQLLQKVTVPFVSAEVCGGAGAYPGRLDESMICAGLETGGKDSCQGDSGGPLFTNEAGNRKLAGVVSWGEGCARPKKYGIYAKVSAVIDWIDATAQ
jgi:trypsin